MIARLSTVALLATTTAFCGTSSLAQDFGDYALESLKTLVFDYPGRYAGTQNFTNATAYMTERLGFGGNLTSLQSFSFTSGRTTYNSNNVLATLQGSSDKFIVVGAHFDTFLNRPTLQGVDDNGSGAAVLTELAAHMSGLELGTSLVFNSFGAEEQGLRGSRAYVAGLTADERANLAGMINLDSLITGDFMYAHAGVNIEDDPALKSYWEVIHRIAAEEGIDLKSNPGLNADYPIDTGCCSDGDSFTGLDIPVLYLESTNWDIGAQDGYDQTTNPAIPGGATWHNPTYDNWDVLVGAFGDERIPDRLEAYSLLLTRLLVELTDADLIAAAREAGAQAYGMADLLVRTAQADSATNTAAAARRLGAAAEVGSFTGAITAEGRRTSGGRDETGFDTNGTGIVGLSGAYQVRPNLSLGAVLSYARATDELGAGGELESRGLSAGLNAAYEAGSLWTIGGISYGKRALDADRAFTLRSGLGLDILSRSFAGDSDATLLGASVSGGYDLTTAGGLTYGPVVGVDYARIKVDGYAETGARGAVAYDALDFETLELSLGGKVAKAVTLGTTSLTLAAQAAVVRELADGRPKAIAVTSIADGSVTDISFDDTDKAFGRVGVSAEFSIAPSAIGWVSLGGRVGHAQGSQAMAAVGVGVTF